MDEEQIDAGEDIPIQQKKYRKKEASLKRMKEMYEARQYVSDLEYVKVVAEKMINIWCFAKKMEGENFD